jgi:hypothetical protein
MLFSIPMSRNTFLLSALVLFLFPSASLGQDVAYFIDNEHILVQYQDKNHEEAAQETIAIYPTIKAEIENTFGWSLDFRPRVIFRKDHESFQASVRNQRIVAYAVPQKNHIVFDPSMMKQSPFSIGVTLKHELSHLFLHHHIPGDNLPKWLDEGIAQWISGGVAEILAGGNDTALQQASVSRTLIPIRELRRSFPGDEKSLLLAYEESKSLVEFIVSESGPAGLRRILDDLRAGTAIEEAILKALGVSLRELEVRWRESLRSRFTWVAILSRHLYSILFFLAGLATVIGFIRFWIRKRAYKDEAEE